MSYKTRLLLAPAIAATLLFAGCSTPTTTEKPDANAEEVAPAAEEAPAQKEPAKEGTRSNPLPIGTKATAGDWYITIDSVNLNGTESVAAANEFNEPPAEGNVYIVVTATTGYIGEDDTGQTPFGVIEYVSTEGKTIQQAWVQSDGEDFTTFNELYVGGSHTGNLVFEVPAASAADGVLAVTPDMLADKAFVSVK